MKIRILFFILTFLIFIYGCAQNNNVEINYKDITSEELNQMLDSGEELFLVDVHIPEQQHIKGTDAFIPYNEIEQNLDMLPEDKNSKIVLYCRSGSMSREAAQTLADLDYKNIYNHLGGINDWREKGFEFE